MSEKTFKAPRSVPEIQNEYQNLCVKAGHLQYSITTLKSDLDLVNSTLRDLNIEAAASQQQAQAEAAKAQAQLSEIKKDVSAVSDKINNTPALHSVKSE